MPTVYGNNGRFEGDNWVMDCLKSAPSGDPSEKCGNDAFYSIPSGSITSRSVSGYCFNLPGNPSGWTVTYNAPLVTSFKKGDARKAATAYRLEKTKDFSWGVAE
jgi:hypothetical protein